MSYPLLDTSPAEPSIYGTLVQSARRAIAITSIQSPSPALLANPRLLGNYGHDGSIETSCSKGLSQQRGSAKFGAVLLG